MNGILNMLNQPEFRDLEKLKALFTSLEEDQIVKSILMRKRKDGTDITIGEENSIQGINQCSVITTDYKINGKIIGSIGVLGPTRMNYSKAVTVLEYVTDQLSWLLEKY
ncbi:HrcA family transcriptional regulator [Dehalobacterium formicoaceticum]|uniref:HrcA family transcriptional regulator n=1 Tax=Dehalobacterium formicoaceticum TaxID=51515 RepID=UPI000B7ECC13|nr:HrcA family transcriptional regulator [Dehalobacterium formicoaceticum]